MTRNRKHIVSIILAMILLMPTLIKLEHHHDHNCNHDQDNRSTTLFEEKCFICDFQFSTFVSNEFIPYSISFDYIELRTNSNTSFHYLNNSKYSFLLRAPPVLHFA